jgi:hypothetical protein
MISMSQMGQNSPYAGGVSYVRTWGQSGKNQIEIRHRSRNVRTWSLQTCREGGSDGKS